MLSDVVEILAILNFGGFMKRSEFFFFLGGEGFLKNQYMGVELPKRGGDLDILQIQGGSFAGKSGGGGVLRGIDNAMHFMLMESLLINRNHPPLNKKKQSVPLELFDS